MFNEVTNDQDFDKLTEGGLVKGGWTGQRRIRYLANLFAEFNAALLKILI